MKASASVATCWSARRSGGDELEARRERYAQQVARSRSIDPKVWHDLLAPVATEMLVGATYADPSLFPEGFGISRRTEPGNEYLGLVMTWPEPNTFVLGLNYFDVADGCDNEDIYKLDLTTFMMTPYMCGAFEQEYPQYAGHHWAAKPYLRAPG